MDPTGLWDLFALGPIAPPDIAAAAYLGLSGGFLLVTAPNVLDDSNEPRPLGAGGEAGTEVADELGACIDINAADGPGLEPPVKRGVGGRGWSLSLSAAFSCIGEVLSVLDTISPSSICASGDLAGSI